MRSKHHCLVFDPISFNGGSKIATRDILTLTNSTKIKFTIITMDRRSWENIHFLEHHEVSIYSLPYLNYLSKDNSGCIFWLKQFSLALLLFYKLIRIPRVSYFLGASGPGTDMALYLIKQLKNISIIQIIHGMVAPSRSIGNNLTRVQKAFYLPSAKQSLINAIAHYLETKTSKEKSIFQCSKILESEQFQEFINGIPQYRWPSQCQYNRPIIFWSASLLKWKGLDLLITATNMLESSRTFTANICFIRPNNTNLPISHAPILLKNFKWYQEPLDLDSIRKNSNIFISTSQKEPFGLSVLEAMAAGMCVIIPKDGAYWDTKLTNNINCIKYTPKNAKSLANAILYASNNQNVVKRIGQAALKVTELYHAEHCYEAIINYLNNYSC
ncbi:lipopolysaccharide synthesis protein [Candidatus Photodesmus blepharus]|uniref:Lipopolysaccharide synthesis protein n=1 Tax=Candidatus Photodesmus blepharonis TaxID=1179155 RepID=A0A084CPL8_9GAMM|nr:glycosyltransferase family 4 protein [Candidatus Photodesmus blepharus]KEY91747.1 lipopolysaccharide synthesis protein [Candidatus Photodesmus blepharus]